MDEHSQVTEGGGGFERNHGKLSLNIVTWKKGKLDHAFSGDDPTHSQNESQHERINETWTVHRHEYIQMVPEKLDTIIGGVGVVRFHLVSILFVESIFLLLRFATIWISC